MICGANGAGKLLEELDARGYQVTAGVVNQESGDWDICQELGIPCVAIAPFTPVTESDQTLNLKMMETADIILVADMPFGESNLNNLSGLEDMPGRIYFHKNALSNDHTHGALVKRLQELGARKKITYIGDHDAFLDLLKKEEA